MMTPVQKKARADRAWDLGLRTALVLGPFLAGTLIAHEIRINRLEDVSITSKELRDDFPPAWLHEDIQELKAGQKDIRVRLRELEQRR